LKQQDKTEELERDYGRLARFGILTPQANPTVEPEMGLLFPSGVTMLTSRCTSRGEPRQRFLDYFRQLDQSLQSFDTLQLDAAGFACTASSYLLDENEESKACKQLEQQFGFPLVTAAMALREALDYLDAKSIALACPYPDWLQQLAVAWWQRQGFHIETSFSMRPDMGDTRAIYELRSEQATQQMTEALDTVKSDVIVITGTGMPSLGAIIGLQDHFRVPVISSNLALAWACLKQSGTPLNDRAADAAYPLLSGWQSGLAWL